NIAGIKNVIVVQNKIDLVSEEEALDNYKQIKRFLEHTDYKNAPIIPISALHKVNIDILIETIEKHIPTPKRDPKAKPVMFVARSFDVNRPGTTPDKLTGGILGGTLRQGVFKIGDEIEIRPGRRIMQHNKIVCQPIKTKITALHTGGKPVDKVNPGGSVGLMTSLDPNVAASDNLVGSYVGKPDTLPQTLYSLKLKTYLLERVVGAKDALVVKPIIPNEVLMLNVNSASTVGVVSELHKNRITAVLKLPICAEIGSKVTISRSLGNRWRLIGYGIIEG
ncbi:translation initiation factor IF-2 subunit gamma, partial [Candidatus Woesearchaeota archaeon]|nr:translation initiation factor IF-2 subunit gamma [Candidatus Woesearchaeota archaeon]